MMGQLLAHLWGDYLLQSDWMALNKRKDTAACTIHAAFYMACFLPLVWHRAPLFSLCEMSAIFLSHLLIDRFGLARYVVWAKNFIAPRDGSCHYTAQIGKPLELECRYYPWERCSDTGYDKNRPAWLTVWLLIIADNTLHLTCNYLALRYL
jgi:hypothetical protein